MGGERPVIDPWGTIQIEDYSRLFEEFGIEPIGSLVCRLPNPSRYLRRSVVFGHRDLQRIIEAIDNRQAFAVMSGIKPTGEFHLGTKMTAEEIIYFQHLSPKARAFYCIADVEAYADNGIPFDEGEKIAVGNVADLLALGLDPKKAYIYRQSAEIRVLNLASIFSRGVTYSTLKAVYGEKTFGLYMSALIQVGDILLPQLKDFGGPKPVVVPVGADQDPHLRLTRDLASKYRDQFGFVVPSATYHKLTRSLSGEAKMSKRDPMSYLLLNDSPELARQKVLNALTGGRETVELQRKLGGEPEKCVVYELGLFHFIDNDDKVKQIYEECVGGKIICGDCKCEHAEYVVNFLKAHQKKRKSLIDTARKLLTQRERSPKHLSF